MQEVYAMKTDYMVTLEHATKKFKSFTALDDISLNFERGKIHGIIGRNGSGKTVLLKCLCGLMKLTSGNVYVDSKKIGDTVDIPPDVGAIIETPGFLPYYDAVQNLMLLASIRKKICKNDIISAIEMVGLDPKSKQKVGQYSLGMRQRLGVAQAIMERPSLLILDEPMNGLDNQGVDDMRKLIASMAASGCTIVLASHNKDDINILCNTVIELDKGKRIK